MQRSWEKRNVDLALLILSLSEFFKEKDFEAIRGQTKTGYQILACGSPHFKLQGDVTMTLEGKPENFMIELTLSTKKKQTFRLSPFLLSMLGGGYVTLQELKSREAWIELEKQFWKYTENTVLRLTNTAKNLTKENTNQPSKP